nr:hypothetical protein [Tanacetum cinerariifolium]
MWENIELLMKGSGLSEQHKQEKLFDEYERFHAIENESILEYFIRFRKLANDIKITKIKIPTHQHNTQFLNNLPSVDPLAYLAHYLKHQTSTIVASPTYTSSSTLAPEQQAQSGSDAIMATMQQLVNLLSGFQKQFLRMNNHLRTSSNPRSHATVHEGQIVTEIVQRKAPGNVSNAGQGVQGTQESKGHPVLQRQNDAKDRGAILDAEAEAFLTDVECTKPYDEALALTTTTTFQVSHEDAYDSNIDDGPYAATAFMANLSSIKEANGTSSSNVNEVHSNAFDSYNSDIDDNTIPYQHYNFSNMIFNDTDNEDTTRYPSPLVTKKFFANMRHYQGPDRPLLAYMLNQGELAFVQALQQESSPPPIPFGPEPSSRVASTKPIPNIPSASRPSKPVQETISSPIRDDDTGGSSFHESPPSPLPATPTRSLTVGVTEEPLTLTSLLYLFPTCLQKIATLEAELKATKILHRDTVVLFAKRIKKLESKLKTKKRKLVLTLHDPSDSTTPSKPANPEQSSEQEISPTTLDTVLTLSQSKARARAATIIYKRIKKQQSSFGLDITDAAIPATRLDSASGLHYVVCLDSASGVISAGGGDYASGLTSASISVAAGPSVLAEPLSLIRDPAKGKAVATPSLPLTSPTDKELADQQAAILEAEKQELLEQERKQILNAEQVYLDSLLAQRVAEEQERESRASATQSTQRQAKLDRVALNLTNEEWIGLVDQVRANPTLFAELLGADEPTFVSAGAPILAVTSIPAVTFVPTGSSIPAVTPSAAGASGSASDASVSIIELLDSPPKDTSIPLDLKTEEQDATLRKPSRKKSIAKRRSLPSYNTLCFWVIDVVNKFAMYLLYFTGSL